MNLLPNKNAEKDKAQEEKEKKEKNKAKEDDISESWSLPAWPELQWFHHSKKKQKQGPGEDPRLVAQVRVSAPLPQASAPGNVPLIEPTEGGDEEMGEDDGLEEMKQRGQWNNPLEFLMSIISMSVGLGNFYRFPFVAYQNGGGAFLIPYLIILTLIGRPMYFVELAVGQFCSFGQVKCWEMAPILRGVGFGSALGSFCVVTYYSSVMAVTTFYLINSFRTTLPWADCDPDWATPEICRQIAEAQQNGSDWKSIANLPQLYFERVVMHEASSIDDGIGLPDLKQSLCLFASWVMIFVVIARGVESSGKVAYFTTIFPYVVIVVLLITSCTKEGAFSGMLYFITPDWKKVGDLNVWFAAAGQCFFSLSVGFGPIINYGSYNPFRHPIYKDVMIVSIMDTLASLLAGLTVFATLGGLSNDLGKPIEAVVNGGPGLVFISFSDAIANFTYVPQVLSVLFFLMLLALAVGSAVAWQLCTISVISDSFPKLNKFWITTTMCVLGFLIGLIYVTPGGQFMLTLVDNFGGNVNIYILATLECIGFAWVYGVSNLVEDVEFMLRKKLGWYWKACWGFVVPALLLIIMTYSFSTAKRLEYNGQPFPDSAIICGWVLTGITLMCIPLAAIYAIYQAPGSLQEKIVSAFKPTAEFGPRMRSDRLEWQLYKEGRLTLEGEPVGANSNSVVPGSNFTIAPALSGNPLTIYNTDGDDVASASTRLPSAFPIPH